MDKTILIKTINELSGVIFDLSNRGRIKPNLDFVVDELKGLRNEIGGLYEKEKK